MNVLDISDLKQQGPELIKAIAQSVKDTQSVIIRELPNMMRLTKDQFEMLKNDPHMMATNAKEYLYMTPYNVMELEVL